MIKNLCKTLILAVLLTVIHTNVSFATDGTCSAMYTAIPTYGTEIPITGNQYSVSYTVNRYYCFDLTQTFGANGDAHDPMCVNTSDSACAGYVDSAQIGFLSATYGEGNYTVFYFDGSANIPMDHAFEYVRYTYSGGMLLPYADTGNANCDAGLVTCIRYWQPDNDPTGTAPYAVNTPQLFFVGGYVTEADYDNDMYVKMCIHRLSDDMSADPAILDQCQEFPVTAFGAYYFSHDFTIDRTGRYRLELSIVDPRFFDIFSWANKTLIYRQSYFVVGELSAFDNTQVAGSVVDPTDTTLFSNCDDFSFSTGLLKDIAVCLFVPSQETITGLVNSAKEGFIYKAPWGYATRVYDLLVANNPGSNLPNFAITIPNGLPDAGKHFDLSPQTSITNAIATFNDKEIETQTWNSETNSWETVTVNPLTQFEFWWRIVWGVLFGLWLLRELFNAYRAGDFGGKHDINGNEV